MQYMHMRFIAKIVHVLYLHETVGEAGVDSRVLTHLAGRVVVGMRVGPRAGVVYSEAEFVYLYTKKKNFQKGNRKVFRC